MWYNISVAIGTKLPKEFLLEITSEWVREGQKLERVAPYATSESYLGCHKQMQVEF